MTQPLKALLDQCAQELLAAYGFEALGVEPAPKREGNAACLAAFIGFAGERLRGSLTIVAPLPFLEQTRPRSNREGPLEEADAADWCCEFVNQLLGRLKNKMLLHGVVVEVSTPQGVFADRLRLSQSSRSELIVRVYRVGEFELLSCLDVATAPGEVLFDDAAALAIDQIPKEGDLILF